MFARFRHTQSGLQVSLVETRRVAGKVNHEHVASLGSVAMPATVADRLQFWSRLHERLGKLANRVSPDAQGKVLGEIHLRIPMVTPDEQARLQLENAAADAQFWATLRAMHEEIAEGQKGLVATTERAIASGQASAATAAAKADEARGRIARIEKGESVPGGLGRAQTYEDFERVLGKRVMHRARATNTLHKLGAWKELLAEVMRRHELAEDAAIRTLMRRYGLSGLDPDAADNLIDEMIEGAD
jgi:hypothetical protein